MVPAYIYDVNGYYRELGVSPYATRSQIGRAYQAKDGPNSDRLTFVFQQLLNKQTRYDYDRCELGERFMDEWIRREMYLQMKRAAMARADIEQSEGRISTDTEYAYVVDSIMDWLIEGWENGVGDSLDVLDSDDPGAQSVSTPAKAPKVFPWSYYLWKTKSPEDVEERLAEWLGLLLRAFSEQGSVTRFSIGLTGRWRRFVLGRVGYRDVILMNRHLDPDIEVARKAVSAFLNTPVIPANQ